MRHVQAIRVQLNGIQAGDPAGTCISVDTSRLKNEVILVGVRLTTHSLAAALYSAIKIRSCGNCIGLCRARNAGFRVTHPAPIPCDQDPR